MKYLWHILTVFFVLFLIGCSTPEPDYTKLLNEHQVFFDKEESMLTVSKQIFDDLNDPSATAGETIAGIKSYLLQSQELILLYQDWETFVDMNKADLEKTGLDTTQLKIDLVNQKQNLGTKLEFMKGFIYSLNDGKPPIDPLLIGLDQKIDSQITSLGFEVEQDYTALLAEYQEFVDKEAQMLADDKLIIKESKLPNQTKEKITIVIQMYITQADELISLYSDWEDFVDLNREDLEKAGKDTTAISAAILKERSRIQDNLQVMREFIDVLIQDSPGDIELTNMRNKLTYQINELNSVISSR